MRKSIITYGLSFLLVSIIFALNSPVWAKDGEISEIEVVWDGEVIDTGTSALKKEGRAFLPVRWIENYTDAELEWREDTEQLRVKTVAGDIVTFYIGTAKLYWKGQNYYMDVDSFIHNDRIYLPVRYIAGIVNLDVEWNNDEQQLHISTNEEESEVVITASTEPPVKEEEPEISEEDLMLLAKIIDAESGWEPYEGQVAVGSVIINRVNHESFPNTLRDVIYAPGQFGPVRTGKIDQIEPDEDALRAAEQVLKGEELLEDALYFYNPKRDSGRFFQTLTKVKDIGNHRFMK